MVCRLWRVRSVTGAVGIETRPGGREAAVVCNGVGTGRARTTCAPIVHGTLSVLHAASIDRVRRNGCPVSNSGLVLRVGRVAANPGRAGHPRVRHRCVSIRCVIRNRRLVNFCPSYGSNRILRSDLSDGSILFCGRHDSIRRVVLPVASNYCTVFFPRSIRHPYYVVSTPRSIGGVILGIHISSLWNSGEEVWP